MSDMLEQMVTRELMAMQHRIGALIPVDKVAEEGDHVVLDFFGMVDGRPFPGGSDQEYPYDTFDALIASIRQNQAEGI